MGAGALSQWILPNLPLLISLMFYFSNDKDEAEENSEVEEENLGPI